MMSERVNAATEEGVKKQEDAAKARLIALRLGAAECVKTKHGRTFVWDMLVSLGLFDIDKSLYTNDPITMSYRLGELEGARRIAKALRDNARNEYRLMVLENMEGVS